MMNKREFHFTSGTSNKFWSISLESSSHTVEYGRIGTNGQAKTKTFASAEDALKDYDKLVSSKVRVGYVEQNAFSGTSPVPAPTLVKTTPTPATNQAAKAKKETPEKDEPGAEKTPDPPKETVKPGQNTKPEAIIKLSPEEWLWNVGRKYEPLPVPAPRPFERDKALEIIRKAKMSSYSNDWGALWDKLKLPRNLSQEEAHFWLTAFCRGNYRATPEVLYKLLDKTSADGKITQAEVRQLAQEINVLPENFNLPLVELFSLDEIFDFFHPFANRPESFKEASAVLLEAIWRGFRPYLLPYLTVEEKKHLQDRLRPDITVQKWAQRDPNNPYAFYIAAALGMSEELKPVVESIPDDFYKNDLYGSKLRADRPQELIFGLGDPALVRFHMLRLDLPLRISLRSYYAHPSIEYMLAWLAYTELSALDRMRDMVMSATNSEQGNIYFGGFERVVAPQAVPYVLDLKLNSKAVSSARHWLDEHPVETIAGLVVTAAGKDKLAGPAQDYLQELNAKGYGEVIKRESEKAGPEVAAAIHGKVLEAAGDSYVPLDDETTPGWLETALKAPAKMKESALPPWVVPALLPPIVIGKNRLNEAQVRQLLALLRNGDFAILRSQLKSFKQKENGVEQSSLDKFAWKLFENWLNEGASSKEKWALLAVGILGGDASALKLTPLIRVWPGQTQHQRAVLGLECLRAIGTDTAIMQINGIAQKVPFKGIKEKALETINQIAEDRNMTRNQLEDRIVPDCGLDERGTTTFDFGPRKFFFALSPELKPLVRDEAGKLKPDLPKPNSSDDETQASEAVESWKLIKKQVREISKIQADRLEQAMITGRRWTVEEFEQLLVNHPLMTHLARLLVWATYDKDRKMTGTFRVTEDRSYADENDDNFSFDKVAAVGIVHAAHLSSEARANWGQVLSDYEIIPPFQQLGRTIYRLEGDEPEAREITRFKKIKVPAVALVGILDKTGWNRGIPEDAGVFSEHSKPFYGADVTAIVQYEGVPVGYMVDWEEQSVEKCFFVKGIYTPSMYPRHTDAMKLGQVDEVVVSEVLRNLYAVTAKGK